MSEHYWAAMHEYKALAAEQKVEIGRLRDEKQHIHDILTVEHAALQRAEAVIEAAEELWDNRLGHGDPVGPWHAPQAFWKDLGQALTIHKDVV